MQGSWGGAPAGRADVARPLLDKVLAGTYQAG